MEKTAIFAKDNDILRETAKRLVKALGVEDAIYICRANYWHGVLRLILAEETCLQIHPQQRKMSEADTPVRLHSLPGATATRDVPMVESAPKTAIAA